LGIAYERLARAFDLAAALHQQPIPVRLARLLCKIAKTSPDHVVHETHEDLAGLIGASREAVTRVLSDLRKRGLVESLRHRPGLHVPDPDQLQDVVEGEFR
jgi:CRP/FNR family transcriptional regulator